ncbi:hypothetical protein AYL99_03059 [Fonsecaea erecta]|uniref:Uncharacterized protein n=1 Tax=Fonsecaea erecta TaxID=1367422 RepID=A0A178ZVU2_9EURO|nr:hypothetical protein AYL99_03059 [Fonsecaea erecta]OAP63832.1 hypothetical protein AYL99_03059 [Fonsecaea erecta]
MMARVRDTTNNDNNDDEVSCSETFPPFFPPFSGHRVFATGFESLHTRSKFTRTAVDIMDTTTATNTSLSASNTSTDDQPRETSTTQWPSEDSQDQGPSPSTVNEVDLSSTGSGLPTVGDTSSPTVPSSSSPLSLLAATSPSASMTTFRSTSPSPIPSPHSSTVSWASDSSLSPTSLNFSTSTSTPTSTSAVNTLASPPSSAYTTGIYIALGIFLFFGVLCAFVTSHISANTIKGLFHRGERGSGGAREEQ